MRTTKTMWLVSERPEPKPKRRFTPTRWKLKPDAKQIWNDWKIAKTCSNCGYNRSARALQLHHVDKKRFQPGPAKIASKGRAAAWREIAKCSILCANCHSELHDAMTINYTKITPEEAQNVVDRLITIK